MEKNSWISKVICLPTVLQFDWKKLAEKPSGPGALSGCIEKQARLISSGEGIKISFALVSSEIRGYRASLIIGHLSPACEVKSFW